MVPPPLAEKKFVKKNGKCNQDDFSPVLLKSYWTTFKTIFETLLAQGACHVTITEGVVYKKSMIFEVFGVYLSEFLIFLHEIFFGSKILPSSCDKHQNFDYGSSSYPGNEAQSPDFGHFLTILGIFRAVCFGTSLYPRTLIFLWKISSMYVLSRVVKDFFMISSFEPIINTMQTRFS